MQETNQKQFYLMVKGKKVVVSEEVYKTYMKTPDNERKRIERENRCILEKVVNGKIKTYRCKDNCSLCDKNKFEKSSTTYSLDLMLSDGFDVVDKTVNIEEDYIEKETIKELRNSIEKLNDKQKQIVKLIFFDGLKQYEVAKLLGISKATVSQYVNRITAILKRNIKI